MPVFCKYSCRSRVFITSNETSLNLSQEDTNINDSKIIPTGFFFMWISRWLLLPAGTNVSVESCRGSCLWLSAKSFIWKTESNVPAAVIESSEWHMCWELLQAFKDKFTRKKKKKSHPRAEGKVRREVFESTKKFLELHSESVVAAFS